MCSSLNIIDPNKFNSIFSTIVNNLVSSDSIIYLQNNFNNFLSFYNIINNNCPNINYGIIYIFQGKYLLNNSILFNNKNILFFSDSELTVLNCNINHNDIIFYGNIFKLNNLILDISLNTFLMIHYSTKFCSANYLKYLNFQFFNNNIFIFILLFLFYFKFKK